MVSLISLTYSDYQPKILCILNLWLVTRAHVYIVEKLFFLIGEGMRCISIQKYQRHLNFQTNNKYESYSSKNIVGGTFLHLLPTCAANISIIFLECMPVAYDSASFAALKEVLL